MKLTDDTIINMLILVVGVACLTFSYISYAQPSQPVYSVIHEHNGASSQIGVDRTTHTYTQVMYEV